MINGSKQAVIFAEDLLVQRDEMHRLLLDILNEVKEYPEIRPFSQDSYLPAHFRARIMDVLTKTNGV